MCLYCFVFFVVRNNMVLFNIEGYMIFFGIFVVVNIWCFYYNLVVWGLDYMQYKFERFFKDNFVKLDFFVFLLFFVGLRYFDSEVVVFDLCMF